VLIQVSFLFSAQTETDRFNEVENVECNGEILVSLVFSLLWLLCFSSKPSSSCHIVCWMQFIAWFLMEILTLSLLVEKKKKSPSAVCIQHPSDFLSLITDAQFTCASCTCKYILFLFSKLYVYI
jgi:hypothetical protein